MKKLALALAFLPVVMVAAAQETSGDSSFGVIIYAEGDIVSVIRDQRRYEYDAFTGELLGLAIYPGDIIQTDPNTYVEIQLLPSRSVVKVAENTSFTVEQVGSGGEGVFDLSYGRLRARVSRLSGTSPFEIRGVGAVAGVRGTDFGTDVVVTQGGSAAKTQVYCFEGEVEVRLTPAAVPVAESAGAQTPTATVPEPIIVAANQMVTTQTPLPSATARAAVDAGRIAEEPVTVVALEPEIQRFWQSEDFVAEAKDAEVVLAEFPYLKDDAIERLGLVRFMQPDTGGTTPAKELEALASSEPTVEPEAILTEQTHEVAAQEAVTIEAAGDEEPSGAERASRLIGATRVAGISMIGLGAFADAAAVGLYFFGDQILPNWPAASDPQILSAVGAAGGVLMIGGIVSLLFGIQLAQ